MPDSEPGEHSSLAMLSLLGYLRSVYITFISHRPGFPRLPKHGFVRPQLSRVNGCTQRELGGKIQVRWKEISSERLGPVNDGGSYGDKGLDDICLSNWGNDPGLRRISD